MIGAGVVVGPHVESIETVNSVIVKPLLRNVSILLRAPGADHPQMTGGTEGMAQFDNWLRGSVIRHSREERRPILRPWSRDVVETMARVRERAINVKDDYGAHQRFARIYAAISMNDLPSSFIPASLLCSASERPIFSRKDSLSMSDAPNSKISLYRVFAITRLKCQPHSSS